MIELRLARSLYAGSAVDEAARVFAPYAAIELIEDPIHFADYWIVRVTAAAPDRERAVAGELANHALGRTVQKRPADLAGGRP